jgi:type IV secretion system protein VirB1
VIALLSLATVMQLAAACPAVPGVTAKRILAYATVESGSPGGFDPLAIHDNTAKRSLRPATLAEAVTLASTLTAAGHSIDAGLMQVNSANWGRLQLTAETVFVPQINVCAGVKVLAGAVTAEHRVACRYNTGAPDCTNGYPDRIDRAAAQLGGADCPAAPAPACPEPDPNADWHTVALPPGCQPAGDHVWHTLTPTEKATP